MVLLLWIEWQARGIEGQKRRASRVIELVWVVDDNADAPLRSEHGLAVWVETEHGALLLDTGGSGDVLLHNMHHLGLDPGRLSAIVLSHAHDDHTGGITALLPLLSPGTALYAHPAVFRQRFSASSGVMQPRGLQAAAEVLSARLEVHLSRSAQSVLPGVWTTGEIAPRPHPEGRSRYHYVQRDGVFAADPYEDDLSLVIRPAEDELFLLCGCCHAGLLNTLDLVARSWSGRLSGIGGGVHLGGCLLYTSPSPRD